MKRAFAFLSLAALVLFACALASVPTPVSSAPPIPTSTPASIPGATPVPTAVAPSPTPAALAPAPSEPSASVPQITTRPNPTIRLGSSNTSVAGLISLPELGAGTYLGFQGGLYPGGGNEPPPEWEAAGLAAAAEVVPRDANGDPNPDGKIVLLSIGQIFVSPRTYGGYALAPLNPEPFAFETAFAFKWLIEERIKAGRTSPWLDWGPYLWANGLTPNPQGLTWTYDDFVEEDRTHPSPSGIAKVGGALLDFFASSPYTRSWFVARPSHLRYGFNPIQEILHLCLALT